MFETTWSGDMLNGESLFESQNDAQGLLGSFYDSDEIWEAEAIGFSGGSKRNIIPIKRDFK